MKKLSILLIALLGVTTFSLAQGPVGHWRLGGNPPFPPPDGVNATNNILGTAAGANFPLRIATNGTERFRITEWGSLQGWPGSTAPGIRSIAFGLNTTATGDNSQAFGT